MHVTCAPNQLFICAPAQQADLSPAHATLRGAAYLVVADEGYGRAIPAAFLDKMATDFTSKFADKGAGAKEGGLNGTFGCVWACISRACIMERPSAGLHRKIGDRV